MRQCLLHSDRDSLPEVICALGLYFNELYSSIIILLALEKLLHELPQLALFAKSPFFAKKGKYILQLRI